ncbi:LysR family transcriptional regulator [Cognatishimia sp. D5M38]|uniref:DNA-binding transcriptional regulator, LysR family n=2 Tax=Rhodobacterales TaxID=204455 RepID=A0A1I4GD07_9RHOB|nr:MULTISPECIES: LysR family transcriptional regulator [Roseobacteraceae]CRL16218.1 D-malate degradation protein R [Phaeobacter italicus]SFH11503.1 DNA-binding transcriptional regulator, LysR family [Phaeobacter italicus]SFL27423.1 DNA-binding transcriptional regulator, LysR family [Shimia haliotis]
MDLTDELKAFVATAQTGSFTAAADQLGVSNRLTSKYVAELEARLGVRLFQRTTRKVGLTPAGEDLLARAPALLDDLDDLLAEVSEGSRGFTGVIRVSAPVTFGELYVVGMLRRFADANPGLSFDLRLSDAYVDLARDGIDLAFRIGRSEMLSLKERKLGTLRSRLVASPTYLTAQGQPDHPADLAHHACIVDTNRRAPRRWVFHRGEEDLEVQVQGRFHVNSARAAAELATNGLGIAYAPRFAICDGLSAGKLVELMQNYSGDTTTVNAVYLEGRALPRKIRALIDFAVEDIKTSDVL